MDDAEKEVRLQLYRWSMAEALRESEAGYPTLKLYWDDLVALHLYIADAQTAEKRLLLTRASVKRFHPQAVLLVGEPLTTAEREILSYCDNLVSHHLAKGTVYPLRHGQKALVGPPLSRKQLIPILRGKVTKIDKNLLGTRQHVTKLDLNYEKMLGEWQLSTHIGADRSQLSCVHGLIREVDKDPKKWVEPFSLSGFSYASLLGISSMGWRVYTLEDAETATSGLAMVCAKILTEVPPLLQGTTEQIPWLRQSDCLPART